MRVSKRARQNLVASDHIPAPLAGLSTIDPADPRHAVRLVNMVGGLDLGLSPRLGYKEHVTGLGGEVRSLIGHSGASSAADMLFACTQTGIRVATVSADNPGGGHVFAVSNGESGYGNSVAFETPGGRFTAYADEANGYLLYTEGGEWAAVTGAQVTGVNPLLLCQVCSFKSRLWFVKKGSTEAYYLPINSIYGAAKRFDFGAQFPHGGTLAALYAWSLDGGSGSDDKLVAISTAGDVVIYEGTDPAQFGTFQRTGGWFLGGVPTGRRLAVDVGGDLLIIAALGLMPVSRLPAGRVLLSPDSYATQKVQTLFNKIMADRGDLRGWGAYVHPTDAALMISYPALAGEDSQQFAMSLATRGWSMFEGLPIFCATTWRRGLYFGTQDGRVCINTGDVDNVPRIANPAQERPIRFSVIPTYRAPGGVRSKQIQMIRPRFVAQGTEPTIKVEARYDFDTTPPFLAQGGSTPPSNAWDTAKFDEAKFGAPGPFSKTTGAIGLGTYLTIAMTGESVQRCSFIGHDYTFEQGGFL